MRPQRHPPGRGRARARGDARDDASSRARCSKRATRSTPPEQRSRAHGAASNSASGVAARVRSVHVTMILCTRGGSVRASTERTACATSGGSARATPSSSSFCSSGGSSPIAPSAPTSARERLAVEPALRRGRGRGLRPPPSRWRSRARPSRPRSAARRSTKPARVVGRGARPAASTRTRTPATRRRASLHFSVCTENLEARLAIVSPRGKPLKRE